MINYHNNPVTGIGRDPDAYIIVNNELSKNNVNYEHSKKSPLAYATVKEYFGGIRWLIQNRHASVQVKDQHGYDPIDWCFIKIEQSIRSLANEINPTEI